MWRHIRGQTNQITVTVGSADLDVGDPICLATGVAVVAGDGDRVDGVMHDAADSGETAFADLLIPGSVWEAPVSSVAANEGVALVAAASGSVDGGAAEDPSFGWIVDKAITTDDTVVHFVIERSEIPGE